MEGKAALFKRFAGIDAWPICLATQDTDEIVRAVEMIAPGFGGINLEDIAAPRCFEIERRLRESLDIPVFHDDQHGTAIVVMAALTNAMRVVGKELPEARVVVAGAGAAGTAIVTLLLAAGRHRRRGLGPRGLPGRRRRHACPRPSASWPRSPTRAGCTATCTPALTGADVFIGVSGPGVLDAEWITDMADDAVVFALANPDPEVDPARGREVRRGGGQRPLRLPQPDQQRAGVPRRLPRPARRPGLRDHRRHAAARRRGDRARRQRRRAQPELHHPAASSTPTSPRPSPPPYALARSASSRMVHDVVGGAEPHQ